MPLKLTVEDEGRSLIVLATGTLTKEDYGPFVAEVNRLITEHGKISILFHMRDFHGWQAAAMWEDTKFGIRHFHDIDRLAVVGEKAWQKGLAAFCKPFTSAEVRSFDQNDLQSAREWLHEEHAVGK